MLTRKFSVCSTISSSLNRRGYATIANDHWPHHSSFQRHPTPYQILNIPPGAAYTKSRFIELVKLYHPDFKHHHNSNNGSVSVIGSTSNPTTAQSCSQLPESIRLERYRLIVAAHSLLSDPVKRVAYDTHGIGWLDGLEDSLILKSAAAGGKAGRSAHGNATWEDWERWREQQEEEREREAGHERPRPEPYYMRNGQFASLLIVFSIGAGAAQTMHAENLTEAKRLVREERHWVATQEYQKAQELARKLGREQRIEEFVRQRDPAVLSQPTLKQLVMQPDICESGTPEGRAKDLDMKRMFSKK